MRLFVAADLSEHQIAQLRARVEEAKEAVQIEGIRWIPESNWHATIAFIGDRDESELPGIEATIGGVLAKRQLLNVKPLRIQAMPHRAKPRLLALKALSEPPLQELYFQLGKALQIKDRQREFRFHVTVARFRELSGDSALALNEAIKDLSNVNSEQWTIPNVTLYLSTLSQDGASYEAIRTWEVSSPI